MRPFLPSLLLLSTVTVATGAAAQDRPLEIAAPPPPLAAEAATEMNSVPLFVVGTSLAGLGAAAVVTGAVIYGDDDCATTESALYPCMNIGQAIGGITMGAGGILALVATPLIVAGAWQIGSDHAPPTTATLILGPARADLGVTF